VASYIYLTEDQAKAIKEYCNQKPAATGSAPTTPRRRGHQDVDLDNIIQGPRSARLRNTPSSRHGTSPPPSPKASTSGNVMFYLCIAL
jgi:hypothetical protein